MTPQDTCVPDPIFAAIAEYHRLFAQWFDLSHQFDAEQIKTPRTLRHRLAGLEAEANRATDALQAVELVLTKMKPMTPAGASALITCVRYEMENGTSEWNFLALENASAAALR